MLKFRKATINDMELYFEWTNDPEVRGQSYNSNIINLEDHKKWFESALKNEAYFMYIFQNSDRENIGQVRIQKQDNKNALIGISIDFRHRGKGYAKEMLLLSTRSFLEANKGCVVNAYIKETNLSSKFSFEKGGFQFSSMVDYENFKSFHYIKNKI